MQFRLEGLTGLRSVLATAPKVVFAALLAAFVAACVGAPDAPTKVPSSLAETPDYLVGPGDQLDIFVWRNPELSISVPVRPDGRISVPLIEDLPATGKTPTALARDIEEMALIDGATRWQAFRMVVAPLAVPGIIAVGVMSFMEAWSEFFFALTLTNSLTYPPLLMSFRNLHQVNWNALAAATVIGVIPPVIIAFVFQRYLVRGLSEGAVKG